MADAGLGDAVVQASAPGRVNLIGEHTDYNGGLVLPLALPLATRVTLRRRADGRVHCATGTPPFDRVPADYALGEEAASGGWTDYVMAVTHTLRAAGHALHGFDAVITSDVPAGAGLSSSAALLVALIRGLRGLLGLPLDDLTVARLAHRAEVGFVGSPVGIMDPVACSVGDPRHALLLDTRTLAFQHVPLPDDVELALVDSGVPHRHAGGEYRVRRAECDAAARALGVGLLTDLDERDLDRLSELPAPLDRRARHVLTENGRVPAAARALDTRDLATLGRLLVASHASLRDDFEASLPPIDALVARAIEDPRVYGARLTGGGFGGAVLLLCHAGAAHGVATSIVAATPAAPDARVVLPPRP
jgi:galactokinase